MIMIQSRLPEALMELQTVSIADDFELEWHTVLLQACCYEALGFPSLTLHAWIRLYHMTFQCAHDSMLFAPATPFQMRRRCLLHVQRLKDWTRFQQSQSSVIVASVLGDLLTLLNVCNPRFDTSTAYQAPEAYLSPPHQAHLEEQKTPEMATYLSHVLQSRVARWECPVPDQLEQCLEEGSEYQLVLPVLNRTLFRSAPIQTLMYNHALLLGSMKLRMAQLSELSLLAWCFQRRLFCVLHPCFAVTHHCFFFSSLKMRPQRQPMRIICDIFVRQLELQHEYRGRINHPVSSVLMNYSFSLVVFVCSRHSLIPKLKCAMHVTLGR